MSAVVMEQRPQLMESAAAGDARSFAALLEPLLDPAYRLAAVMLVSPKSFAKFRFYCGLSPRMAECCWYETNTATLLRYATNLLRHLVHDPEAELERLLQNPETRSLV